MPSTIDKFRLNLESYIEQIPHNLPPVYRQDSNTDKELPCVVVEIEDSEQSGTGLYGHYNVTGNVSLFTVGYDDPDSQDQDNISSLLESVMYNTDWVSVLNAPTSGTDFRPYTGIKVNALIPRQTSVEDDGKSSRFSISFDAFIRVGD
jgi:hypothetical protein